MSFSEEKRKYARKSCEAPLIFSLSVLGYKNIRLHKVTSTGVGFDIGTGGMGFYTEYPLEPGNILKIEKESEAVQAGMVRWVNKVDDRFRVGVLFF